MDNNAFVRNVLGLVLMTLVIAVTSCKSETELSKTIKPIDRARLSVGKEKSDTTLPLLNVYTAIDSTADRRIRQKEKDKKVGHSGARVSGPDPCFDQESLYVGGLTVAEAVEATILVLNRSNPCSVRWIGNDGPAVNVVVTRTSIDGSSTNYEYNYTFYTSNGTASWVLTGGNGTPGYPAPTLGPSPRHDWELTNAEDRILTALGTEARATFFQNAENARRRLADLQVSCPQVNFDGNGNAFLHAYWTAMNERTFGYQDAYRLVVAHEAHDSNPMMPGTMDIFNDDLGLSIARRFPNHSEEQLANEILNQVSTGHGKRIVNGTYERTGFNICE